MLRTISMLLAKGYTLLKNIRTSKLGPEAQFFLISKLTVNLLRGVGQLFPVKNDHKRPIYDKQKTVLKLVHKFTKYIVENVGLKSRLVVLIELYLFLKKACACTKETSHSPISHSLHCMHGGNQLVVTSNPGYPGDGMLLHSAVQTGHSRSRRAYDDLCQVCTPTHQNSTRPNFLIILGMS